MRDLFFAFSISDDLSQSLARKQHSYWLLLISVVTYQTSAMFTRISYPHFNEVLRWRRQDGLSTVEQMWWLETSFPRSRNGFLTSDMTGIKERDELCFICCAVERVNHLGSQSLRPYAVEINIFLFTSVWSSIVMHISETNLCVFRQSSKYIKYIYLINISC